MKDFPVPTMDLSPRMGRFSGLLPQRGAALPTLGQDAARLAPQRSFSAHWARHLDDVRAAQRLRHEVFVQEMGARLPQSVPGHDIDLFDDYCEHLLVRETATDQVVGTYRVLTPAQARRVGSLYMDGEFDLVRLHHLRAQMVELGRSCVHAKHRSGNVIMLLWRELAAFMQRNALPVMVGCASVPMQPDKLLPAGYAAASLWRQLKCTHLADIAYRVTPRLALPVDAMPCDLAVEPPALIRGYLRLGARVLGAPAWDPDFHTADLPLMLHTAQLPARWQR